MNGRSLLRARSFGSWLAAAMLVAPPALAQRDPALARELLKEGYLLAKEGKCTEALPLLERSADLDAQATTFLNLARCEETLSRFGDALKHWVQARDLARDQTLRVQREEAETRLASLEARTPRVTIRLAPNAPPATRVERDGVLVPEEALGRPMPIDPGDHAFEVFAADHESRRFVVQAKPSEQIEVTVEPGVELPRRAWVTATEASPPTPPPETSPPRNRPLAAPASAGQPLARPLFYGGLGVGAAALVVGAVAGAVTLTQSANFTDACPAGRCPTATYQDVVQARDTATVANIAFGTAAVGALTAAVGYFLGASEGRKAATVARQ